MKNTTSLVAIITICFVSGIIEPITTGYLHHRIDSSMRATIDSFQSLGLNLVLIIAGLGFGYFSNEYDVFGGYGFIAVLCGVFLVYYFIVQKRI
jgi:ABC-type dipeptide/oligopeptide/nickel transport system permease subunit